MTSGEENIGKHSRQAATTAWHMSRKAVSLSVPEVIQWSDRQCMEFLVEVRFGGWNTVRCPHCGTIDRHYWRPTQRRWKCAGCGSTFSITSGTVFARRKRKLQEILTSVLMWLNSAAGQSALELKRHMDTSYNTAFTLQHKLREAFVRAHNVGLINGDVEMDGAHQSGWRAAEKRGVPQGVRRIKSEAEQHELNASILTQTGKDAARKKKKTGQIDPDFGRALPKDRRILFAIRKRSGVKGKGATATRIAIGKSESPSVVESVIKSFIAAPESYLNTDAATAYAELGKGFRAHLVVQHAKELSGPNGENNNQAEELNARFDRAEKGIYLNIEPKYLLDYGVETAFRSDTRRLPNGDQLRLAMSLAMSVGESLFWKNFTHGQHRLVELLHPLPQQARASGPAKGKNPLSNASGRPPS